VTVDGVRIVDHLDGVDWAAARQDLLDDDFDNGRKPTALRRAFEAADHVAMAWAGDRVVGMARMLSDGVSNAYLVDVWTLSSYRRRGIGRRMVQQLVDAVPGLHVGLQTDDAQEFYASMGFRRQPEFMSTVSGGWLDNAANRDDSSD